MAILTVPENYLSLHPEVENFLSNEIPMYIGGERVAASDGSYFDATDPSTGSPLARIAQADERDVDLAVAAARKAHSTGDWHLKMTPSERSQCIWRLAELLDENKEILGQLDALDNGKPFKTARDVDVFWSAEHFRYFAGWPTKIEGSTIPVSTPGMFNYTLREPIGVCGLIVPWNYPLLMAAWKMAPALAAGNYIILKPAEQTSFSALYLPKLFEEAGFPPGVFNVVPGFGHKTGAALVAHHGVDKIGFTGSAEVAREILKSSVGNLKRVSLELGGKSPNIIFADANLDQAVVGATWAIFGNNGQSCTAGSRLYIEQKVFEEVTEGISEQTKKIRVGPGMREEQPHLGPVISQEQMDRVLGFITDGFESGGEALTGGKRIEGDLSDGYFIEPTVFQGISDDANIIQEEIFGPVVCALPFEDANDVLRRANHSPYGLAAGVWTQNVEKAHHFASKLQAGTIWVNTWGNTDAASPFGGYKQSGHGREMGKEAIDLYSETKSVWMKING
jgi:acyl-CoA reductase-like NAD-dependent aldehyde dehydrogenase